MNGVYKHQTQAVVAADSSLKQGVLGCYYYYYWGGGGGGGSVYTCMQSLQ